MRMEKSARNLVLRKTKIMSKLEGSLQGLWDVCLGGLRLIQIAFPRTIMRVRKANGIISKLGREDGWVSRNDNAYGET